MKDRDEEEKYCRGKAIRAVWFSCSVCEGFFISTLSIDYIDTFLDFTLGIFIKIPNLELLSGSCMSALLNAYLVSSITLITPSAM